MSISIKEAEKPCPKPGELLIKIKTVGICGTDLKLFDGSISYLKDGLLQFPHTPGHEWVGEMVDTGGQSTKFHVGDRVTGECHVGCGSCEACHNGRENICPDRMRFGILQDGGMSEYILFPERAAYKIPDHVTNEEASLIEPLTVALHALDKLERIAGSTVTVTGLGPIGLLLCEVVSSMGAGHVIGVDMDHTALQLGESKGCDDVVDSTKDDFKNQIWRLTNQKGSDIIVEATGVGDLLSESLDLIRPGGQLSLIGLYRTKVEVDVNQIITKDVKVLGNMASARVWERAINLIANKKVDLGKIITHRYSINNVEDAFRKAYYKEDNVGKVVINF